MASGVSGKPEVDGSETGSSTALRRLAAELAADADWIAAVTHKITEAIHDELAQLDNDEELRAATYASSQSNVRQALEILRAGGDPSEARPPAAAIEYTNEYVRRGVSIETLLRAYQVGQACFIRDLSAAIRDAIDDPDEVSEALEQGAELTLAYINVMLSDLITRYAQQRDRWVRSAAAVRAETVRALLAGEPVDLEAAERRLGYSLKRGHLGFVVWSPPGTESVADIGALELAASKFAKDFGGASRLFIPSGSHVIAGWVSGSDERRPSQHLRIALDATPGVRAAIGEPGSGLAGFARSHREAMHARRIAELTRRPPGSVTAYGDVALTALASADLDHARDFVDRQLGALAADDDDILRLSATLRVYLEERSSPRRTAERLGVHANTVTNRIRAAQELLDRPIEGRVSELLVALRLAPVVQGDRARVGQPNGRSGSESASAIAR
jgi:DNA-binding PucR family transcriptional regulator